MSRAYEAITERIVAMLDAGVVPWHVPWQQRDNKQRSASGHVYRGINAFVTSVVAHVEGYDDPRWVTFNQARKLGGSVRRGERSMPLVVWKTLPAGNRDEQPDAGQAENKDGATRRSRLFARGFRVFNVQQCDDLYLPALPDLTVFEWDPLQQCQEIVDGYRNGPTLEHGGERAFYRPGDDHVQMPDPERFRDPSDYYQTLFHELTHSTGHEARLNRPIVTADQSTGYAREELIAELGAAFLCGEAGITGRRLQETTASYIAHWRKVLTDDAGLIIQAARRAQQAAEHILGAATDTTNEAEEPVELSTGHSAAVTSQQRA